MSTRPDLPSYRTLLTEVDRGVATITLNRPGQRNAVGDGMCEELADAYRFCDRDHGVRVVVLTGTPPAFCAGADLADGERTLRGSGPRFQFELDRAAVAATRPTSTWRSCATTTPGMDRSARGSDQRRRSLSGVAAAVQVRSGVG